MNNVTKTCTKCGIEKTLEDFKKQKQREGGYCSWCKKCHSIATCKSVDRNKANINNAKYCKTEKGKIARRKYKAQRRARIRGNAIQLTKEEHGQIRKLYKTAKEMREDGFDVCIDHIIPIARGGLHHPDNLQILTTKQNLQKGIVI